MYVCIYIYIYIHTYTINIHIITPRSKVLPVLEQRLPLQEADRLRHQEEHLVL